MNGAHRYRRCVSVDDRATTKASDMTASTPSEETLAPLLETCTRIERHVTARVASAEELDALGTPPYAVTPVTAYRCVQYDANDTVLAVTTTVVPGMHESPAGWQIDSGPREA